MSFVEHPEIPVLDIFFPVMCVLNDNGSHNFKISQFAKKV